MLRRHALIDSNVMVGAVGVDHPHHELSFALFAGDPLPALAIAAHSFAEAYVTLTKRDARGEFGWSPTQALAALEDLLPNVTLIGMTPEQTVDTVRDYALKGGIGARLYDRLIGQVAATHNIATIITWNVRHMKPLFPDLKVLRPPEFLGMIDQ